MSGQAKGSLFLHSRQFLGPTGWHDTLAALGRADRDELDDRVATSVWYPIGLWNRLLRQVVTTRGAPTVTELSRHIAKADVNFLFRMLLKMGSPELMLRRCDVIWSRYFDVGTFRTAELEPRHWRLTLDASRDENDGPSVNVCTWATPGWIDEALALTGAQPGRLVHTRCRFDSADQCEWSLQW
jgi:hypothetical protein